MTDSEFMQTSYNSDHLIVHLSKNNCTTTKVESHTLKTYPYNLMFSSKLVQPTMTREELKGLADFIYNYLENN